MGGIGVLTDWGGEGWGVGGSGGAGMRLGKERLWIEGKVGGNKAKGRVDRSKGKESDGWMM